MLIEFAFAVPVLVFFGLLVGQPLTLVFTPLEVVSVGVGVLIASYIALDGKSNWVEGLQLVSVYLIVAIAFFCTSGDALSPKSPRKMPPDFTFVG